jgi:membrane dipeptidase
VRLIDLHCNWALQYAPETTQYDPALYSEVPSRLGQLEGFLTGVSAAVLACGRRAEDWARQPDPWQALREMIARYEAEFSGRLLLGPADAARWEAEPGDALCWGVLAVEGLDFLVREAADLDRIPGLFARGVRVYQLVASDSGRLGGSDRQGDERGLSDLGLAALERLASLAAPGAGPAPALDLAGLNRRSAAEILSWFEADTVRVGRLLLARTRGGGLEDDLLRRFRALGGTLGLSVGPPHAAGPETLRREIERAAALPLGTRPGYEGIGLATDFPAIEQPPPRLGNASRIAGWLAHEFPSEAAAALAGSSARALLLRLSGGSGPG